MLDANNAPACSVRYRKVASDKCVGGPLVEKYRSVQAQCPVMKPEGLGIEVAQGQVVTVDSNISFSLTQERVMSRCGCFCAV